MCVLFLPRLRRQGEDRAEATWGQMAGTEIANEEIAFGNSVTTSGTYVLYLTPALGERAVCSLKRRAPVFRTVAPHPEGTGGPG